MSRLVWNPIGQRFFESGIEHGVLYVDNVGVAWNGLVAITESTPSSEYTSYYVDGIKYLDKAGVEEFTATLEAYTYPDEFLACEGVRPVKYGLFATQQRRKSFGLCYKTSIGNDVDGVTHAFKLHIVYNCKASPSERGYRTLSDQVEPYNFTWNVVAKPPVFKGLKPTPNFVIDSRDVPEDLMETLLDVLYGTLGTLPRLPSLGELLSIFENYEAVGFDAGHLTEDYFASFDAGHVGETYTSAIDGGTL